MKNKRGQVTIFIIISIIFVAGIALFLTINKDSSSDALRGERGNFENYVSNCFDKALKKSIFHVSERGGYREYNKSNVPSTDQGAPYYIHNNITYVPKKDSIQSRISEETEKLVMDCVRDFSKFGSVEIKERARIETNIKNKFVRSDMSLPMSLESKDTTFTYESFSSRYRSRTQYLISHARKFVQEDYKTNGFCVSCLGRITNEEKISSRYQFDNLDRGTVGIGIQDTSSQLNGEPLEWVFANEF